MYVLMLSIKERSAIDWVGHRYSHGDDLYKLLWSTYKGDVDWNSQENIIFHIPEHIAWQINEIIQENDYALECFSDELKIKLIRFSEQIV